MYVDTYGTFKIKLNPQKLFKMHNLQQTNVYISDSNTMDLLKLDDVT